MTNTFDPTILGDILKRLIKDAGDTQEEFAELVHVEPRTLRNWVGGKLDSIGTLCIVANALQMDVMAILSECLG